MTVKLFAAYWQWVDDHDIDKHVLSMFVFYGTIKMTDWAMMYAALSSTKTGMEVAAIIAAVTAPYMALQAAAIKFYFQRGTS
jgi:hypothetical protein